MATININIEFDPERDNRVVTLLVPFEARVHWSRDERNRLFFAFEINGHLYRPKISDIIKIQKLYGVRGYKCVAEYMKGEVLTMYRTY